MGPFILYRRAFSHGCTPVHRLYEFELISYMCHPLISSIWLLFASCTGDLRTYSHFIIFWISYVWAHKFCMGEHLAMAVRWYIDCTNFNLCHKCPTHWFHPFGCFLHPLQFMYRRTSNFKWSINMYCGIAGNYGCTPVQKLYESGLKSQMFHSLFQSSWR